MDHTNPNFAEALNLSETFLQYYGLSVAYNALDFLTVDTRSSFVHAVAKATDAFWDKHPNTFNSLSREQELILSIGTVEHIEKVLMVYFTSKEDGIQAEIAFKAALKNAVTDLKEQYRNEI